MTHTLPTSPATLAAAGADEPDDPTALVVAAVLAALHALPAVRTKGGNWDESKHDRDHGKFSSHPGAKGSADAGTKGHTVKLPKNRRKLTIDQANAALGQMGYKSGASQYDFETRKTLITVTFPNGKVADLTAGKVKDLVYSGAAGAAPKATEKPAPTPKPKKPAGKGQSPKAPPGVLAVKDIAELAKLLKIPEAEARKLAGEDAPEPTPPPPPPEATVPVAKRLAPSLAKSAMPIAKRIGSDHRAKVLLARPSAWAEKAAAKHAPAVAKRLGIPASDAHGLLSHLIQRMAGAVARELRSGRRVTATARVAGGTLTVRRKGLLPESPTAWLREKTARERAHKFSTTQVNLTGELADVLLRLGRAIRDEDLADDGREVEPHVTCLYGLETDDPAGVTALAAGFGPVRIRLGAVGVFAGAESGKDYDVLIVEVDSPDLHRLHRLLGELPHTDTFREYKPHCTLAYTRAGVGGAYAAAMGELGVVFHADRLAFRDRDGRQTEIDLTGPPAPPWSLCGSAGPVTGRMKSFDEGKVNRDKGKFASKPGKSGGGLPARKARRAEARGRNRAATAERVQDEFRVMQQHLAGRPLAKPVFNAMAQAYIAFLEQPTRALAAAAIDPGPLEAAHERAKEDYVRRAVGTFAEGRADVFGGMPPGLVGDVHDLLRDRLAERLPTIEFGELKAVARGVRDGTLGREEARRDFLEAMGDAYRADPGPDDLPHPDDDWVKDELVDLIAAADDTPASDDDPDELWEKHRGRAGRIAEAFHAHLVALAPERREKGWSLPPLAPVGRPHRPRA